MTLDDFIAFAQDNDLAVAAMLGFNDCVAGVVSRFGQEPILCYDLQRVLAKLVEQGMTEIEAQEWYDTNMLGAWVGDGTPCFIEILERDEHQGAPDDERSDQPAG